jgi:glycosyltransferase involved in cell wall biosynthesis
MNILFYTNTFLPFVGGKEIVVHQLVKALRQVGHDARVAVPGGMIKFRHARYDYPVYHFPVGVKRAQLQAQLLALKLLRQFWRFDVVHAHNTYPAGWVVAKGRRWLKAPLVVTPHGYDIQTIPEIGHGMRLDPELRPKVDYAVRNADLLTSISRTVRSAIEQVGGDALPIWDVPNGTDLARFHGERNPGIRAAFDVPADARIVLTVGNYFRRRGFEELVAAMQQVGQRDPRAHLVIVGRGTGVLTPLIESLGLSSRVTLTGPMALPSMMVDGGPRHDPLADLYKEAELYVSAGMADAAEGLSLALLDAMAAHLPIVATRISGNKDVISDRSTGLLVEPGCGEALADGILALLQDERLAATLADHARSHAESYGWPAIAERYLAGYEAVCAGAPILSMGSQR